MPGVTQPYAALVSMGFLGYLVSLTTVRLSTHLLNEDALAGDWATNTMRLSPLGGHIILGIAFFGIFFLMLIGYYGENDDGSTFYLVSDRPSEMFYGMPEYSIGLVIVGVIYAEKLRKLLSEDAACIVSFTIWVLGILISIPIRLFLHLVGAIENSWAIGMPILLLWTLSHFYLLKRFKIWRSEKEISGEVARNKALEEFIMYLEYEMRWTQPTLFCIFIVWMFQIEYFLDTHQVGYGFALFYYVVAFVTILGCIDEYRINDF